MYVSAQVSPILLFDFYLSLFLKACLFLSTEVLTVILQKIANLLKSCRNRMPSSRVPFAWSPLLRTRYSRDAPDCLMLQRAVNGRRDAPLRNGQNQQVSTKQTPLLDAEPLSVAVAPGRPSKARALSHFHLLHLDVMSL